MDCRRGDVPRNLHAVRDGGPEAGPRRYGKTKKEQAYFLWI
jgi:hypothetical protein